MNRQDALDLLGDLLPEETNLFGETKKKAPKPKPQWKMDGLKVVIQERVCEHCGHVHVNPNPLLLMSETYYDADGNPTKSRQTSQPDSYLETLEDVDFDFETVSMGTIPFCSECCFELTAELARKIFAKQRAPQDLDKTPKQKDLKKQEQAEEELFNYLDDILYTDN